MTEPLWTPSAERLKSARLGRFMAEVRATWGVDAADYAALARLVDRRARAVLALDVGTLPASSATVRASASSSTATGCRAPAGSRKRS